ncbi:MAG TPA: 2-dehydropantoate 2-reductase [Kofleriaceae bacterium]|nr:2-dehydropantoate 2-reductase [Kofleriaceae bacterium]
MPRIVIFGAGAIGCWIGGRLAVGGADVILVGRPRVLGELERGLQISELGGGQWTVHPTLATEARDGDVILVCTKSAQTADAARALAGTTGTIVSMQNGVRNVPVLRDALPGRTVLAGMVPFNVVRRVPGSYHRGSGGTLAVENRDAAAPLTEACARADLALELRDDMLAVQWAKLVLNLNNAINALSGKPLAAELGQRGYRQILADAQREALELLRAANIHVARVTLVPPRWMPRLLALPDPLFRRLAGRVVAIDPYARSSMWDDLEAKRPTEIDYINGEVVALAERLGTHAPVNAGLVRLVREAEAGGKRDFSSEALRQALQSITANAPPIAPSSSASRNRP